MEGKVRMTGNLPKDSVIGGEIEPWRRSPGKDRAATHPGVDEIASNRVTGRVEDKTGERLGLGNRKVEFQQSQKQGCRCHREHDIGLIDG